MTLRYLSIYLPIGLKWLRSTLSIALGVLLTASSVFSQNVQCITDPIPEFIPPASPPSTACYNVGFDEMKLAGYKPSANDPIKYMRIKIYVMQQTSTDPQNFSDIPAHRDYLGDVISIANGILKQIELPIYGGVVQQTYPNGLPHIGDSRIQLVFNQSSDIEFIPDLTGWGSDGSFSDQYLPTTYGVDDCYFDFFITGGIGGASGYGPQHYNIYTNWWNEYNYNEATGVGINKWQHAMLVLHEIGHSLGLPHSYHGNFSDILCPHCGGIGFCDANCGAFCDPNNTPYCLSNIMSGAANSKRNYTPFR